jgi:hypothetical protein
MTRTAVLWRIAQLLAHIDRPHGQAEQVAAAKSLGVLHKLPEPQGELNLRTPRAS